MTAITPPSLEKIQSALAAIPPDNHDLRDRMAKAIKSELGDGGFELWDSWYQGHDSYNPAEARDTWRSNKPNGGVAIGTLFYEAKQHGWADAGAFPEPSREEIEARREAAEAKAQADQADKARRRAKAKSQAKALWESAMPAQADHPYLMRKRISPTDALRELHASQVRGVVGYAPHSKGQPLQGRILLAPVEIDGQLSTVEFIDEAGIKSALARGAKSGGYWAAQALPEGDGEGLALLVGEGVATVMSATQATGFLGVAALAVGNLEAVAKTMRLKYPKAALVLLADLVKATGEPDPHAVKAARAVGGGLAVPAFKALRETHETDFNDLLVKEGPDAASAIIQAAVDGLHCQPQAPKKISLHDDVGGKKSQATLLIEIAGELELVHTENHEAFAVVGGKEVWAVRSQAFRQWLSRQFYALTTKGCNGNAVADAISTIEAKANFSGDLREVFLRCARVGDALHIDLCNEAWESIEIDGNGWRIRQKAPVCFVRKQGMSAFPTPVRGGSLSLLEQYLNLGSGQFPLVVGWIMGALRGAGPYPLLVLQGEQGTGKSTTCRILRKLADPSTVPLRSPPREVRDLLVSAANNHLVVLDNLSGLAPEISDCLCRFSTGGGLDARALYSNTEQILVDIQRPVLANGIDDIATRPDLAERSIILNLPVIQASERRDERGFWQAFDADYPLIFGAILDALSCALRHESRASLAEKPRMADFALWALAAEGAPAGSDSQFIRAYRANQIEAIENGIEASPVGSTVLKLLDDCCGHWRGTPTALLETLTEKAGFMSRSRAWPQSTKGLRNAVNRLQPNFRQVGVTIEQDKSGDRFYTISRVKRPENLNQGDRPAPIYTSSGITAATAYPPEPTDGAGCSAADRRRIAADGGGYGVDTADGGGCVADAADSISYPPSLKPSNGAASGVYGGCGGYSGQILNESAAGEVFDL
jgi:phage/plasmid primase-like uncharacterized protein